MFGYKLVNVGDIEVLNDYLEKAMELVCKNDDILENVDIPDEVRNELHKNIISSASMLANIWTRIDLFILQSWKKKD